MGRKELIGTSQNIDLNTFIHDDGTGGYCIAVQQGGGDSAGFDAQAYDITNNTSTNYNSSVQILDYASGGTDGTYDINVFNNTLTGDGANSATGVWILGLDVDAGTAISDIAVSGNAISGFIRGIHASDLGGPSASSNIDLTTTVVTQNNITGNTWGAMNETGQGTLLNAENNWWGDASGPGGAGPGTGDPISIEIDADPWIGNPVADTDQATVANGNSTSLAAVLSGMPCTVDLQNNSGSTANITVSALSGNPSVGFTGMIGGNGIGRSLQIDTDLADGTFLAVVQLGYTEAELTASGIATESEIILYTYSGGTWVTAVSLNTVGGGSWQGDAPVPALGSATLGDHGVDTTGNIAWAVVDHASLFGAGEGSSGVPVELSIFTFE